jgi:DNA-binding transcriptional ArsR family regulator
VTSRSTSPIESLDDPRLVRALSHPLRVRILSILDERTSSAVEISRDLRADIGVVAYHIRTLHRLGLLELVRETPRRGAIQRFYRALPRPQITAPTWADASPVSKQAHVDAALQQIHEIAGAANAVGGFDRPGSHFDRKVVKVDAEGLQRLTDALERTLDEIKEIEARAAERQAGEEATGTEDVGLVMMVFAAPSSATRQATSD